MVGMATNLNIFFVCVLVKKFAFPFSYVIDYSQERCRFFIEHLVSKRKDTQKMMDKAVKENRMISTFEGRIRMGIGSVILLAGIYNFVQSRNYGSLSVRLFSILRSFPRETKRTTGIEFRRIGSIQYRI